MVGASAAILVGVTDAVALQVRQLTDVELELPAIPMSVPQWMRALRLHQWLKNLLVLVALLTSSSFGEPGKLAAAGLAFMAMCLLASATYLANDVWDVDSDRQHPRKRHRAVASGALSMARALFVAGVLLALALVIAASVSTAFLCMLLIYLGLTTAYSLALKRLALIDVITLACLYSIRVLAGAVAISVQVTPWLLAFCVFIFFSLALVKRCAELVSLTNTDTTLLPGRGYRPADLAVLWPMGVGSALCAVVVFGLFVTASPQALRYANAQLLWGVGVGLIYWLGRLWLKTARGEMDDDPLVFALRDRNSRWTLVVIVGTTVIAQLMG